MQDGESWASSEHLYIYIYIPISYTNDDDDGENEDEDDEQAKYSHSARNSKSSRLIITWPGIQNYTLTY